MKNKYIFNLLLVLMATIFFTGCESDEDNNDSQTSGFIKTTNTFTINDSNVTWQDNPDVYTVGADSNTEANQICENKTIDGYSDWRLPTKLETFVLYSTNRSNLEYTYDNYKDESYFDDLKLRHLTWTTFELDNRDIGGNLMYGVMNEILATKEDETEHTVMFLPAEGYQSGQTYSIRCIRDHTIDNEDIASITQDSEIIENTNFKITTDSINNTILFDWTSTISGYSVLGITEYDGERDSLGIHGYGSKRSLLCTLDTSANYREGLYSYQCLEPGDSYPSSSMMLETNTIHTVFESSRLDNPSRLNDLATIVLNEDKTYTVLYK